MKSLPFLCLFLLAFQSAQAGSTVFSKSMITTVTEVDPFAKGGREVDVSAGFLYSPVVAKGGRPVMNYAQGDVSLGWMLTSPSPLFGWDCLRGNWEGLVNGFGAGITKGQGGFLAGGRLILRYNFVQPDVRWVPFFQIGAGGLGDNVYLHQDQRLVGSGFEFTLVSECGLRYFITPKWAAMVTIDFEHISNANTACRNLGINAGGGMFGVGWFF